MYINRRTKKSMSSHPGGRYICGGFYILIDMPPAAHIEETGRCFDMGRWVDIEHTQQCKHVYRYSKKDINNMCILLITMCAY